MSDRLLEELGTEVTAAARREDRRRRGARRLVTMSAAAVAVVVVAVGALLLAQPGEVVADVEVLRHDDHLLIKLNDLETRPGEVEAAAAEAGLDVDVVEVPVGPSNVGRIISTYQSEGTTSVFGPTGPEGAFERSGFRVPLGYEGRIVVHLGRAAEPGEQWQAASLAVERGEVLACQDLVGAPLADTAAAAQAAGLPLSRLSDLDPSLSPPGDRATPDALRTLEDRVVIGLDLVAPDELWVTTAASTDAVAQLRRPIGC